MEGDHATKYWAILVGINFYRGSRQTLNRNTPRTLAGCIEDVKNIKRHLETTYTQIRIQSFTSSTPPDDMATRPAEAPGVWPTKDNLANALRSLIRTAQPGDYVYIHYSGHGLARTSKSEKYGNHDSGDLSLVLYDPVFGYSYLQGSDLAILLKELADYGLQLTLVLDCCFSGAVMRNGFHDDYTIRSTAFDPQIPGFHHALTSGDLIEGVSKFRDRDGHILPTWLINPENYAILTACSPFETSGELTLLDGTKAGALSFFLLQTLHDLRSRGLNPTFQMLYEHLRVQFHARFPRQSPGFYGSGDRFIFPNLPVSASVYTYKVYWRDERLLLNAGEAHGICVADQFVLSPAWVTLHNSVGHRKACCKSVASLTSELESELGEDLRNVGNGWQATPATQLHRLGVTVEWSERIQELVEQQHVAAKTTFFGTSPQPSKDRSIIPIFYVDLNSHNEIVLLDAKRNDIATLPRVSKDSPKALDSVISTLVHITRFKYIEAIYNRVPDPDFEQSFNLKLVSSKQSIEQTGILKVEDGEIVSFSWSNFSQRSLYLHVLNLRPTWEIRNLLTVAKRNDYIESAPAHRELHHPPKPMKIRWTIPQSLKAQGVTKCEDVLKIFITTRPNIFSPLELQPLSGNEDTENGVRRGESSQNLEAFLNSLGNTWRGLDVMAKDYGQWQAVNFIIQIETKAPET